MAKAQTNKKMSSSDVFAANLRGLMAVKGVSAAEMQEYMCISPATFYKRLRRPYEFTLANVESAAKKLGVSAADMMERVMTVERVAV